MRAKVESTLVQTEDLEDAIVFLNKLLAEWTLDHYEHTPKHEERLHTLVSSLMDALPYDITTVYD